MPIPKLYELPELKIPPIDLLVAVRRALLQDLAELEKLEDYMIETGLLKAEKKTVIIRTYKPE